MQMSNPFIEKEISKIMSEKKSPENMALASAWIVAHFKGVNIKILDVKETSSLCDYNLIASAENTTQARAMVDEIVANAKNHNVDIISLEGMGDAEWVLLDLGDVILHIFQEISREAYDLDSLWSEHDQLEIPQEYYFGQAEEVKKPEDPTANYF
jgi:ribosome-associated protein